MYRIVNYATPDGRDVYREWHERLRDARAKKAADRRLSRMESGNFGDHKYCGSGVWELRIDHGPGYRIYYALMGTQIVLLLCAGDKSSQQQDIARAATYLKQAQEEGAR